MARQSLAQAAKLLGELPGLQRVALCMKLLDGKSQREIASALELSEGYVSKLVARAEARIREQGWRFPDELP